MTDFEEKVIGFIGESKKALEVLEQGQRDQGERLGKLETAFHSHEKLEAAFHSHEKEFANPPRNGNGWKTRVYQGGSLVAVVEVLRHIAGEILSK